MSYFLSYARLDQQQALGLADALIAAGVSVWVDQYDIRPSQHWDRAVESAVRACHGMIVILSPNSAASPNVADEVTVAIDDGKDLIPFRIAPCKPPLRMSRMQFIDAVDDFDGAVRKCLAAIRNEEAPPAAGEDAKSLSVLPAEVTAAAERRLIGFVGPVASVLVKRAARGASSEGELYERLARSLPDAADRQAFLGWLSAPRPQGQVVTPRGQPPQDEPSTGAIEEITQALRRRLGPIAAEIVRREARRGGTRRELCIRLGMRIADPDERAAFLREADRA